MKIKAHSELILDAYQFNPNEPKENWPLNVVELSCLERTLYSVLSDHSLLSIFPGDWVVIGTDGDIHVYSNKSFQETYEVIK